MLVAFLFWLYCLFIMHILLLRPTPSYKHYITHFKHFHYFCPCSSCRLTNTNRSFDPSRISEYNLEFLFWAWPALCVWPSACFMSSSCTWLVSCHLVVAVHLCSVFVICIVYYDYDETLQFWNWPNWNHITTVNPSHYHIHTYTARNSYICLQ